MIRRETIDISMERKVLSNLIMSTQLLGRMRTVADPSLFESTMGKAVSQWLWDFWDHMGEAPGRAISDIYAQRSIELREADRELVQAFLSRCSDDWMPSNPGLAEQQAIDYFQGRALVRLRDLLDRAIDTHDNQFGLKAVSDFSRPEVVRSSVVDIFRDAARIREAYSSAAESLFSYPEELGRVIGPNIAEDFIAFCAPPKRGKTWWLMATAMIAALQGLHVLFISLEMPEPQMLRRFWQMLNGLSRYGEEVPWPEFEECGDTWRVVDGKRPTQAVDISPGAIERLQDSLRKVGRGGSLKMMSFPTGTLTLSRLRSELKNLEVFSGFVPRVIVLDYADIMDHGRGDSERDRLNATWKGLRGLAMERKSIVVTATQTNRETVDGVKDAGERNLAEDIRKLAHVTKLISINQTEQERERGIYRLGCKTMREGSVVYDQVVCTSCLDIGRPYLECRLLSQVDLGTEEEYRHEDSRPRRPARGRR